ncbi:MAG: hypothetical protein IPH51_08000 [Rubrivivax sp.]|nr:hypothetical protein [Rubrivivax sp.]
MIARVLNHGDMQNTLHTPIGRSSLAVMPWSLRAWPPLLWQAGDDVPAEFHHLSTRVMASAGNHQRVAGQTIWAGQVAGGEAGMAWDWVEISSGIVAMADPMSVLTNLRIIGDEGEVLTAQAAARFLTGIVHALPWQDEVGRALATCH